YISTCREPKEAVISIGATRYTPYGESTFLKAGDEVIIVVYNDKKALHVEVLESVKNSNYNNETMSVLAQKVI
ncbi:MAG: DUF5718 family protein, partial [Campylobacterales bacterium]